MPSTSPILEVPVHHLVRKHCSRLIAFATAVPPLAVSTVGTGTPSASAAATASVSIDVGRTLATLPDTGGYHWQTHTVEGGYVAPNTGFGTFMSQTVPAYSIVVVQLHPHTAG
ncbi:hypothetical protein ABT009_21735 [Streptomyces sp. NPDC002896]|uniref:hypothetical protein n=1 Tax=Streptomyces sp. NPDC002896 TaxID=3154438 RepID=UPI00332082F3